MLNVDTGDTIRGIDRLTMPCKNVYIPANKKHINSGLLL
jgi:hypothetical protein